MNWFRFRMPPRPLFTALACWALLDGVARAQFVTPVSYVLTAGEIGGLGPYYDDGGAQLTDGIFGSSNWQADLGGGQAYEWIGWSTVNPTATLTFTGSPAIQTVYIGFARASSTGAIYLPATVTIGGTNFPLTGTEFADESRGDLTFSGAWTGNSLQIDLTSGSLFSTWLFVDEIRFSTTAIPEPGAVALAGGLAALILGCGRRRQGRNERRVLPPR